MSTPDTDQTPIQWPTAEELAIRWHNTYEHLIGLRPGVRLPWRDMRPEYRQAVTEACRVLRAWLHDQIAGVRQVAPGKPAETGRESASLPSRSDETASGVAQDTPDRPDVPDDVLEAVARGLCDSVAAITASPGRARPRGPSTTRSPSWRPCGGCGARGGKRGWRSCPAAHRTSSSSTAAATFRTTPPGETCRIE